jgi:hypothetical protein
MERGPSTQQLFVVEGLRSNLLGLPAIKALSLATRSHSRADETEFSRHPRALQEAVSGTGQPGGDVRNPTEARSNGIHIVHSKTDTATAEGEGITTNGDHGSDFKSRRPNPLVCGDGCSSEEVRRNSDLRGPQTLESVRPQGSPPSPKG